MGVGVAVLVVGCALGLLIVVAAGRQLFSTTPPYIKPLAADTQSAYVALVLLYIGLLVGWHVRAGKLNLNAFELLGMKADIRRVETQVLGLQEQIQQLYESRITEVFDDKNWDQIRFATGSYYNKKRFNGQPIYWASVTLKQIPIPASLSVSRGPSVVQQTLLKVQGRELQFLTYSRRFGEDVPDPIVISYHSAPNPSPTRR